MKLSLSVIQKILGFSLSLYTLHRGVQQAARVPKLARDVFENGTRALAKIYELQSNNLILNFLKAITQFSIHYYNYTVIVFLFIRNTTRKC